MTRSIIYALPGTMCDERVWTKLKENARTFTLAHIAIPKGKNIQEIVERLAQELPDENLRLLGFSLGGYLAAAFCLSYPCRIKKLVIVSNAPCALPTGEIAIRRQLIQWLQNNDYSGMGAKRINYLLHKNNKDSSSLHRIIAEMDRAGGKSMLLDQLIATSERQDLSHRLRHLDLPMDFVYGEDDILVDESLIKGICEGSKDKRFHKIKGAGHMLPLEQSKKLSSLLDKI